MSKLKIEAFFSTDNDLRDISMSRLLEEIKGEYGDRVEIMVYTGQNELFNEYSLTATPAVVIEEMIKIMGFCPSKETLIAALHEAGME